MAIQRIPIVAAFTALAFAIEDIIVWILGGQSVIGRFIGSWDDFKAKVSEVKDQLGIDVDVMKQQLKGLADILIGALTLDKDRVLQGLRDLFVVARGGRIAGSVQIDRDTPPNGRHRAEITKLLVHPDARRQGLPAR